MPGDDKLTIAQFAEKVKQKYPQYKDINDTLLTQKMIEKYPEYKDMVQFETQPTNQQPQQSKQPTVPTFMDVAGQTQQTIQTAKQNVPKQQVVQQPLKQETGVFDVTKIGGVEVKPTAPVNKGGLPIGVAVGKDKKKEGSTLGGIYNTLVGSLARFGGGVAQLGTDLVNLKTGIPYIPGVGLQPIYDSEENRAAIEGFIEKARTVKSTKQQEQTRSQFDLTDGISASDVEALAFQAPSQLLDLTLGALTYGSSFFIQAVNDNAKELEQNPNADKLGEGGKLAYVYVQAVGQSALEKFGLDRILKGTGLNKAVTKKIANEITDELVAKGGKATAKQVQDLAIKKASQLSSKIKKVGLGAALGFGVEGATEGAQEAANKGIKLLTNKLANNEVFDEQDIIANFKKDVINSAAAGGVFGSAFGGGAAAISNTNKSIRRQIAQANKPEDFQNIANEINAQVQEGNLTPQEAEQALTKAQEYAEIATKIPQEIDEETKYDVIGGIEQRKQLEAEIQKLQQELQSVDPAFAKQKQDQLDLLNDKLGEVNDYIQVLVTGEKPKYVERNGKYFKIDPATEEETEISKGHYELANAADLNIDNPQKRGESKEISQPIELEVETPKAQKVSENDNLANADLMRNVLDEFSIDKDGGALTFDEKDNINSAINAYEAGEISGEQLKNAFIQNGVDENYLSKKMVENGMTSDLELPPTQQPTPQVETAIPVTEQKEITTQPQVVSEETITPNEQEITVSKEPLPTEQQTTVSEKYKNVINKVSKNQELTKDEEVIRQELVGKKINEYDKDTFDNIYNVSILKAKKQVKLKNKINGEEYIINAADFNYFGDVGFDTDAFISVFEKGDKRIAKEFSFKNIQKESSKSVSESEATPIIETPKVESKEVTTQQPDITVTEPTTTQPIVEEVKSKQQQLADKVRKLKIDLSKLSEGGLQSNPLGLPVAIWNSAMDIVAKTIEAGGEVAEAIRRGLNYIQKNHRGQWNKKQFNDEVMKELGVRGITVNGEDLVVKDVDKEFAETINGFYSDLEQSILEIPATGVGTAASWIKKIGTGDEAKWTGISEWLNSLPKEQKVSRKEVLDWLKDNRIQIVEVVKESGSSEEMLKERNEAFLRTGEIEQEIQKELKEGGLNFNVEKINKLIKEKNDLEQKVKDLDKKISQDETKFGQYQLEGAKENYKEVLVTLPKKEIKGKTPGQLSKEMFGKDSIYDLTDEQQKQVTDIYYKGLNQAEAIEKSQFKSTHFDEPNILVHLRMNTRTDAEGKKVLFLEEVQSDWGQKGKKEGFAQPITKLEKIPNEWFIKEEDGWRVKDNTGFWLTSTWDTKEKAEKDALDFYNKQVVKGIIRPNQNKAPQAPFVTETPSWTKLGLKVALKEAVKQGADKVAWTTGEQQNERYDLSKQVDEIVYSKGKDGTYQFAGHKNNEQVFNYQKIEESKLEDYVGKEVAKKIIDGEGEPMTYGNKEEGTYGELGKTLSGIDLKVGGKGMKGFYGSPSEGKLGIVGEVAKSLFKQEPKTVEIKIKEYKIESKINDDEHIDYLAKKYNTTYGEIMTASVDESKLKKLGLTDEEISELVQFEEPLSVQHSIDITSELKQEAETGLPLFKDIKGRGKEIADMLRKAKIKMTGLQSNIAGIPIALYNTAIETIAKALEGGATLAQAIQTAIKKHKLRQQKDFNQAEFIAKLEEATGEKFTEETQTPPTPPIPPVSEGEEQSGEGRTDERRFTKQMLETPEMLPEAKGEIAKTLKYAVQTNAMSAAEASEIIKKVGLEEATALVMDRNNDMNGGVRVVMAQAIIKSYNELATNAKDQATKEFYLDKTITVAKDVTEKLATDPGQMIQAFSLWQRLSPEGQIRAATQEIQEIGEKRKQKRKKDINNIGNKFKKANEEAAEEVANDKDVKSAVEQNDNERIKKARVKIAKAKAKRENLIKKYKGEKGKNLFATGVPGLSKEGIEFVGEVALTYIQEGVANVEILAEKIRQHLKDVSGKEVPDNIYEEVKEIADKKLNSADEKLIGKELKEQKLVINDIIKQHYTVAEEAKKSLADKLVEKAGLTGQEAADLAAKVEAAFDRIATRKKKRILFQEKARFDRIKNGMKGANTVDPKTLQGEMIRYSNLGAFDNDAFADMIAEKLGTGKLTPQEAQKIIELSDKVQKAPEGSPKNDATEDLLAYRANLKGTSWSEVAQGIWYANVLSGYKTHEKNLVSNFFNAIGELSAQALKNPSEAPFLLYGFLKGERRGALESIHTVLTGRSPIHVKKIETPNILERKEFIGGKFNPANWAKFVTRAIIAGDVFVFQGLKEARAHQLAAREAKKAGATKGEIWKVVDELLLNTKERYDEALAQAKSEGLQSSIDIKRRVYELMESTRPVPMMEDSYGFAAEGTFNHLPQGTLGALTNGIAAFLDMPIGGSQPLRYIVPFTRIIANIVNQQLNYTPIGLIRAARGVRGFESFERNAYTKPAYVKLTSEQRKTLIAKASLGMGLAAALYALSKIEDEEGEPLIEITGGGTGDYKKDQQLREAGWQEYSIKIGDKYWSYKLTPLIFMLGFFGNMNDKEKYAKTEDDATTLKQMELAMWRNFQLVGESSWINSAGTLLGAFQEGAKNQEQIMRSIEQALKGFVVPQGYTQAAQEVQKIFNMPQKQVDNAWQNMIQDIPIARNSLNDKINVLGDPIVRDVDVLNSEVTPDPVLKFLLDNKGWVAPVNKNSMVVFDINTKLEREITEDEYFKFSELRGKIVKREVQKLMNSTLFKVENLATKELKKGSKEYERKLQQELKKISTNATEEAKSILMPKDLDIQIIEEIDSSVENLLNLRP